MIYSKPRLLSRLTLPIGHKPNHNRVKTFEPKDNSLRTTDGQRLTYDYLVVAAGIQIDWDKIEGLKGNLGTLRKFPQVDPIYSLWFALKP